MLNTDKMYETEANYSIRQMKYTDSKLMLQVQRDTGKIKIFEKQSSILKQTNINTMIYIGRKGRHQVEMNTILIQQ